MVWTGFQINRTGRKEGDEHETDEGDAAAGHQLFHSLAFCARIVVAVTFEEVDGSPDCETSAQSDNEGLEDVNRRVKEIHTFLPEPMIK